MRFAVISDVHGNSLALDAVLDDIARHGVDGIFCLGDTVSGPVDPAGTAQRLMGLGALSVRGNHDRWTVDTALPGAGQIDVFARSCLSPAQLGWLDALPATAVEDDKVFLCHGTPTDDDTTWLDRFYTGRTATLPDYDQVAAHAAGLGHEIMLCGHSHVARSVRLEDGRRVINPGSVGMQLVHGSPDARYGIIERRSGNWHVILLSVPYDHGEAARLAAENGFPQWAASLTGGWVGPQSLG